MKPAGTLPIVTVERFEARLGRLRAKFETEREARQWLAQMLGVFPAAEDYRVSEIGRDDARLDRWTAPELWLDLDDLADLACAHCGSLPPADRLDDEHRPICARCDERAAEARAAWREVEPFFEPET